MIDLKNIIYDISSKWIIENDVNKILLSYPRLKFGSINCVRINNDWAWCYTIDDLVDMRNNSTRINITIGYEYKYVWLYDTKPSGVGIVHGSGVELFLSEIITEYYIQMREMVLKCIIGE